MIFVISGKARSGKDSVYKILSKCGGFTQIAFADPLKRMCSSVFSVPLEHFYDDDKKDALFEVPVSFIDCFYELQFAVNAELPLRDIEFISPRDLLQQIGMMVRENVDKDYWIKLLIKDIQKIEGNVAITDARMKNEREALKAIGGKLLFVKNPNISNSDSHISENDLGNEEDYEIIINNAGTLAELQHDITMWYTLRYAR